MRLRCPDARAIGKAKLMQHKFCFRYHADATACEGAVVEGVLWVVSNRDLEQLDWAEGCPDYYKRKVGLVTHDASIVDAWFYTMKDRHPLEIPDRLYYETCKQGMSNTVLISHNWRELCILQILKLRQSVKL